MPTTMTPYEHDASIRLAKINAGWQEPLYQPTIKWDDTIRRHKPSEPEQHLTPNTNRRTTARQLSGYLKSRR